MIIMDLKADNLFAFKKFHVNFSYPKKIVGNTLGSEALSYCPGFRYKKVNIIMGANATGKTTLGRLLNSIFRIIQEKNIASMINYVSNPERAATFSIEFVGNEQIMYRVRCQIMPSHGEAYSSDNVQAMVVSTEINPDDTYDKCRVRLNEMEANGFPDDYIREFEKIGSLSWCFEYPLDYDNTFFAPEDNQLFLKVANHVMRVLDPSIEIVEKLEGVQDSYVIRTESDEIILKSGEKIYSNMLSSGTKAGVGVATMLTDIISSYYGFYFCDEKFSYIDSEVEKAVLSVMIGKLKQDEQLFFTTHNVEILEMDLPKHAYMFMKKDSENQHEITCLNASDLVKRNTDSLRRAVENDLFSSLPSVELIYELESLEE